MTRRPPTAALCAAALVTLAASGPASLRAQTPTAPAPNLPHVPAPGIERAVSFLRNRGAAPRSVLGLWLGPADTVGIRIDRVTAGGPAAGAGLLAGEYILSVNGTPFRVDRADEDDALLAAVPARRLERLVGPLAPGSDVTLRVRARDGRERTVRLRTVAPSSVADRGVYGGASPGAGVRLPDGGPYFSFGAPPNDSVSAERRRRVAAFADSARALAERRPALGLTVAPSGSARDTLGLFVSSVVTGGPAERAGIVEGDRIAAVGDVDLRVPRDERDDPQAAEARRARFVREIERARPGDRVTLRVWGDGRWRTVAATVARATDVYRNDLGRALFGGPIGRFAPGAFGPGARGWIPPRVGGVR